MYLHRSGAMRYMGHSDFSKTQWVIAIPLGYENSSKSDSKPNGIRAQLMTIGGHYELTRAYPGSIDWTRVDSPAGSATIEPSRTVSLPLSFSGEFGDWC